MIKNVYSVFDSKAATYGNPWFDLSNEVAMRNFSDSVNDRNIQGNQWNKHPEDFTLFHIGTFNDQTGMIVTATPVALVTASACLYLKPVE